MSAEIKAIEQQIYELTKRLNALRKKNSAEPVLNYEFQTQQGTTSLLEHFGEKDKLLVIHNMG